MTGTLITALPRRRLEYSFLAGSTSQTIVLLPEIATCNYNYAGIFVRVHSRSMAAGQSLQFNLYNILPTQDDLREFVEDDGTGSPYPLVTVTVTSSSPVTVPRITYDTTTRVGPFLKLELKASQASSPTAFYAELSAELLLRETS